MLRAEIQRALRRAPRQLRGLARLANSPGLKSFRCPRWRIKFSLERFSDSVSHPFAFPAVEKFCRASSAGGVGNAAHDGVPAIVMAIHTFGEYLDFHPHLHALVADKI